MPGFTANLRRPAWSSSAASTMRWPKPPGKSPNVMGFARSQPSMRRCLASDAFSVVTPTSSHFEVSRALLGARKHVLVEKPMTDDSESAAELISLARENRCVLQVGHIERFNPVFKYLETVATAPRFIETHRLSPYPARSTDIGVVLDLMIHDLDVVLAFVKSPVTSVDAVGIPVLSKSEDIANARLRFANGCVANLTVSRISPERMRKIRVFSGGAITSYISLDYRAQEGFIYRVAPRGRRGKFSPQETAASQGFDHCERVCGQTNCEGTGADQQRGTAQARTGTLRRLRPGAARPGSQRRISQESTRSRF